MKFKYFVLLATLFIGVILISGCLTEKQESKKEGNPTTPTIPSENITENALVSCVNFDEFEEDISENYKIYLTSRQFVPPEGIECSLIDNLDSCKSSRIHIIIQFQDILKQNERSELANYGVNLYNYIHNNAYFVSVPANKGNIKKIADLSFVRWISDILAEDKIAGNIKEEKIGNWAINEDRTINVIVVFFKDILPEDAKNIIKKHNGIIKSEVGMLNDITISISKNIINEIAKEDAVQWIELSPPPETIFDE